MPKSRSFAEAAAAMGHTIEQHAAHTFQDGGELQEPIIDQSLIEANVTPLENPYIPYQWGGSLSVGRGGNQRSFGAQELADRHPGLKNLKYLDLPPVDWGNTIAGIGGAALGAAQGAGAFSGGGGGGFDIGSTKAGKSIEALGASQVAPASVYTRENGGMLYRDGGQLYHGNNIPEGFEGESVGLEYEQGEGFQPVYEDGGQLLGYLPEHSFGSWLGDNAGKILKGVGGVVSIIPGFGQIAGPILIGAGYATDAIVGKVRENRAENELEEATILEEQGQSQLEDVQGQVAGRDDQTQYGATFAYGGDLMDQGQDSSKVPMITEYDGGSNSHQDGVGGVPVDAKGNPSTVSKQSAVGLTEKGEVTWNGYVFSDKLTV